MFRKITAIISGMVFVSQTFAGTFIMLNYFLNTAAHAKNCVNKAKPKMQCNGKCLAIQKAVAKKQSNKKLYHLDLIRSIQITTLKS